MEAKNYIGMYGYDPTANQQDMTNLESTNKYGLSYEKVEDPNDTARNVFSVSTQGFRSGNMEQGGGAQKQASLGEGIIGAGTGGMIDTRQRGATPAAMQFGSGGSSGGGANYEQIAKTGASTLASALTWVQGKRAQDVEQTREALHEYINNLAKQDAVKQQKFDTNMENKTQAIGQQQQSAQSSWDQQIAQMNSYSNILDKLEQEATANG